MGKGKQQTVLLGVSVLTSPEKARYAVRILFLVQTNMKRNACAKIITEREAESECVRACV